MGIIKCDECGREISDKNLNCNYCGYPIEIKKTCIKCGKSLNDNENYVCSNCNNIFSTNNVEKNLETTADNKEKLEDLQIETTENDKTIDNFETNKETINTKSKKIDKKRKNTKKILLIFLTIIIILTIIIGALHYYNDIKEQKRIKLEAETKLNNYHNAIELYNNKNHEEAKKIFVELGTYENTEIYLKAIEGILLLNNEQYIEASNIFKSISNNEIIDISEYCRLTEISIDFNNKDYNKIYNDYKNKSMDVIATYSEKEKNMIYESFYQIGTNFYNQGNYNGANYALSKIINYKDVQTIFNNDKYFKLIGNRYELTLKNGYIYYVTSLFFNEYTSYNKLTYDHYQIIPFSSELMDDLGDSGEYSYSIKNNKLYLENFKTFTILNFDGENLILKDGTTTLNLKKI